jgi:signal transduction histidine kinase
MTSRPTIHAMAGMTFCLLALVASQAAWAAELKRVLVLHSFNREVKPWKEMSTEIHTELARRSPWPLDIVDHSIVSARNEDDKTEARYVDYLDALFKKEPIDLILSIGAPAAVFVQRHRQKLFAATPMVIAALEQRRIQSSFLTDNDTVAGVAADFPAVIENILQVLPHTKTVAVVMGDSPNERYWLEVLQKEYGAFAGRVSFVWLNKMSFADILKRGAALPPNSAIFFFLMNVDATGVSFEGDTAMRQLYAVANAPIFTHDDTYFLGRGIVGGPMHSFVNTSRHAVDVAVRVLGGEKPGDIKAPPVRFASPKFDWSEMQRWNISESRLPSGSQIHFREPSVWEQYHLQILAIFATLVLQAILISWLIFEHRRRSRAEILARTSMSDLAHMNRLATAGELSASIAHEVSQPIAGMVLKANAALRWLATEAPEAQKVRDLLTEIVSAGHRAGDVVAGVRSMFKKDTDERAPVDVNRVILTVLEIVRIDLEKTGVEVRTQLAEPLPAVTGDKVQLQQVVLNLAMNAIEAMHAVQPRVLTIKTQESAPGSVRVSIADTGTGFDPSNAGRIFERLFSTKSGGMGMGLSICRSIIENHGGTIRASSSPGTGSVFEFQLPAVVSSNAGTDLRAHA